MKAGDPNYRIEPDDLMGVLDEALLVAVADPDGNLAYVNDRFCEVWKYRRPKLLGKNFRHFDSGSNPPELLANLRKTLRRGRTWRGEIRNLNADGSFCWIDATIVPILDARKRPSGYVAVGSDVTAHKQTLETLRARVEELHAAEDVLRAQEDQLRARNEELRASQKTIEQERTHYRELFDFAPAGYVITDVRGVIREANVGTEELLSGTRRHLVGHPLIGFVDPQSRKTFRELLSDLNEEDSVRQAELFISRGAKQFWAAVSVSPIVSPSGKIEGLRWLLRDMTEEKRRKDKLRETWERLNAVMQNAKALIYVMDKDSRFVFINRRFEEVFGMSSAEVQGKPVSDVFPQNYADFFTANNRKVLKLRSAVEFEETAPLADGVHTYISLKVPQFDARGKPTGVFGISTDITERKRAEEALRESEKLMQLVLNASRIGVWTHDFVGDRTIWSPENCRIFGVEKFDGNGETFWKMVDAEDRRRVRAEFHRAIKQNCFYETEFRIVRPDGKKLWVRGQGQCEYDAQGKPVRFLGTIQDINQRRLAEQSAAENLVRFQNLVKISPYGIFINRITGGNPRIVYANEECLRIFGAESPAEVVGKSNFDFLHPDYHDTLRRRISLMKDELKPIPPLEEKVIALDGRVVDVEITAAPVIEKGETIVLVTMRDITERNRLALEARREQQEKIEILESITEAFVSFDRRLRFIYVNSAAEKFLKNTAAELIGKSVRDVFPVSVSARATEEFRRVLETGGTQEFEIHHELSQSWLRVRAYPTPSGLSVFWQDITERKLSEQLIREKNQLLEQTYDAIFIWRIDNGIIYWNQNAERLYGYTRQEAIGRNTQQLLKTVLPIPHENFINQLKKQGLWEGELIHTTKNGEEVIVEGRLHVIKREENDIIVLETLRDVTERRRIEAEMARAAQLSLVGELAAGLAHEIKNPLAGIKGVIDILLRRRRELQFSDNSEREILENVHHEIDRIDKTVRSLLRYSRPKPIEFKIAPLDETVRRAVQFAFHHAGYHSSSRGKITTELELPETPLFIAHDPAKIEDALLNLILNAEDAIGAKEDGKIIVRLRRTEPDEIGQGNALIEVADNGSGIEPENLTRIFVPFQTTKKEGTGLGLSSVRRVARAHGGDCTVESTPGTGSVFTIRLPFHDKDAAFLEAYNR